MPDLQLVYNDTENVACSTCSKDQYSFNQRHLFEPFQRSLAGSKICVAQHNESYYAYYLGDNSQIFMSTSTDGTAWKSYPDPVLHGWLTPAPKDPDDYSFVAASPSIISYNGKLIMVLLGHDKSVYLTSSYDGIDWLPAQPVTGTWQTSGPNPTIQVYKDQIFLMLLGENKQIYCKLLNDDLSVKTPIGPFYNGWRTNDTPSLAVHNNDFLMCLLGENNEIYLAKYDNGSWPILGGPLFAGFRTPASTPSIISDKSHLYMARTGENRAIYISRTSERHNYQAWEDVHMVNHHSTYRTPCFMLLYNAHEIIPSDGWVQHLDGDLCVVDTHIPGSHDAGCYPGGFSTITGWVGGSITQSANIYEQLKNGSRYLELRVMKTRLNNQIVLHHGPTWFDTLEEVIKNQIIPFSNAHPGEIIFLEFDIEFYPSGLTKPVAKDLSLVDVLAELSKHFPVDQIATEFHDKTKISSVTWGELRKNNRRYVISLNADPLEGYPWMIKSWDFRASPYDDFDKKSPDEILDYLTHHGIPPRPKTQLFITQVVNTPYFSPAPFDDPARNDEQWHEAANKWVQLHANQLNVVYRDFINKDYNYYTIRNLILLNFEKKQHCVIQ